jgi:hypothetical protein
LLIKETTPLYQEARGEELTDELLARAALIGATASIAAAKETTPQNGVVSFSEKLRAATGDRLPDVEWVLEQRTNWLESGSPLGYLAASTEVSTTSGCWSVVNDSDVDSWRDDKGYVLVRDPSPFGLERDSRFGTRSHKLAYILFRRQAEPEFELPPRKPLDHVCRFTGCCNPHHVAETTPRQNNKLQRQAHDIERPLTWGQLLLGPTGYEWLDGPALAATNEDTGLVVNTSRGPFRIIKVEEDPLIIRGQPEPDNLLPRLKPPTRRRTQRPSRAKKHLPIEGEMMLPGFAA